MDRRTLLRAMPAFAGATLATPAIAIEPPTPTDVIGHHAKAISDHLAARQMTCEVRIDAERYMLDMMHGRELPASARVNLHLAGLVAALAEVAGPCDGIKFYGAASPDLIGRSNADASGTILIVERFWNLPEKVDDRMSPSREVRQFDPRTGLNNDWRPDPDLSGWRPSV